MKVTKEIAFGIIALSLFSGTIGCGSKTRTAAEVSEKTEEQPVSKANSTNVIKKGSENKNVEEDDSNSDSQSQSDQKADVKNLEVVNFGYVNNNGYIEYAVAVKNPNKSYAPDFVKLEITGKNPDGSIAFTDDWTVSPMPPESTTYWASQAGHGNVGEDVDISIKAKVSKNDWEKAEPVGELYKIENTSASESTLGGLVITGEITLISDIEEIGYQKTATPSVVAIFKDSDGKILGGEQSYISTDLEVDDPTPFEITCFSGNIPAEYDTIEVYANPW